MTALTLRGVIAHPLTVASSLVAVLGGFLNLPLFNALAAVAWAKAGSLFTVLSIGGFTLGPRVDFIPSAPLEIAAVVGGVLYGTKLLYGVYQNLDTRL
ncbi:hypothetical protein [Haloplanus salinarum]|uniref:hypothetical protein n=1 Tax=Haloplanus salinarum TaxID=1912324 RepID=UPI00214CDFE4|nr:hypothetical protein [Haloplanus salinarum]